MSGSSQPTAAPGITTKASPRSVDDSLERLEAMLATKDLTLFSVVDHSGEAERAGLHMPNTKLVIFGSPAAGTPLMLASPLSGLDLPLKILIWEDPNGATFVSYNDPAYLASRHDLSDELTARIGGIDPIVEALVGD